MKPNKSQVDGATAVLGAQPNVVGEDHEEHI